MRKILFCFTLCAIRMFSLKAIVPIDSKLRALCGRN